jgi:hypothetical protein
MAARIDLTPDRVDPEPKRAKNPSPIDIRVTSA